MFNLKNGMAMRGWITKSGAEHFMWAGIIMFFISSCSPARYTHLKKVKAENTETLVTNVGKEAELPVAVKDIGTDSRYAEPDIVPENELYASAGAVEETELGKKATERVIRKVKKIEKALERKGIVSPVNEKKDLSVTSLQKKDKTSRAEVEAKQGLLWSLVAAVLVVWLVGVLFTNAGGLVHILLGVALILIVMNLLA